MLIYRDLYFPHWFSKQCTGNVHLTSDELNNAPSVDIFFNCYLTQMSRLGFTVIRVFILIYVILTVRVRSTTGGYVFAVVCGGYPLSLGIGPFPGFWSQDRGISDLDRGTL